MDEKLGYGIEPFAFVGASRYEVSQDYMKHLEREPSGIQGTQHTTVKNEVKEEPGIQGTQHRAVETEEGNESSARNRYFWLGEGSSSDQEFLGRFRSERIRIWSQ